YPIRKTPASSDSLTIWGAERRFPSPEIPDEPKIFVPTRNPSFARSGLSADRVSPLNRVWRFDVEVRRCNVFERLEGITGQTEVAALAAARHDDGAPRADVRDDRAGHGSSCQRAQTEAFTR